MMVAMWSEGNESSTRCIGVHGSGHVMGMEQALWEMKGYYIWLWPCGVKEGLCYWYIVLSIIHVYVCLVYFYVFRLLAHPICLCLAMIVYAVHVSRWWCRWSWWGLAAERGWLGDLYVHVFFILFWIMM